MIFIKTKSSGVLRFPCSLEAIRELRALKLVAPGLVILGRRQNIPVHVFIGDLDLTRRSLEELNLVPTSQTSFAFDADGREPAE